LELLGTATAGLDARGAAHRRRVGAVSRTVGLISNLNAWENISLPAAYMARRRSTAWRKSRWKSCRRFGADPQSFLARLPDDGHAGTKIAEFARLLVAAPNSPSSTRSTRAEPP
jgi:ABC-type lipoprotein export system ATPase subunit